MILQVLQVRQAGEAFQAEELRTAAATNGAWAMQATLETYCISLTSGELGDM